MSTNQNKINKDSYFMNLAFEQAKIMLGNTKTNPSVGCIITKNSMIISASSTSKNGRPHAEANTITKSKQSLKNTNLYTTLEPCVHYGKTPPCVKSIVKNKIKKVFFSLNDPDIRTFNKAKNYLNKRGVSVTKGILEKKGKDFYKSYIKTKNKKYPFVTSKIAISKDFYTISKKKKWITNTYSRYRGHLLRSNHDCLLTSSNTVIIDNPKLNCRISGLESTTPARIILDNKLKIPISSKVVKDANKYFTIIFHNKIKVKKINILKKMNIKTYKISLDENKNLNLNEVLIKIKSLGFQRVLLEAGQILTSSFLKKKLVDEFKLFISKTYLKSKGKSSFKNDYNSFLKRKKKINEKINLFGDKLLSIKF